MELCDGSLQDLLDSDVYQQLSPEKRTVGCWDIVRQLAVGLQYCQSLEPKVMHRDIKPANSTLIFD
jgi:serine/threonine protein kinase